jgi:hypothetical protein
MSSMRTPWALRMDTNECRSSRGAHSSPRPAAVVMAANSRRTCQRSSGVPSSRRNTRPWSCQAPPARRRSAAGRGVAISLVGDPDPHLLDGVNPAEAAAFPEEAKANQEAILGAFTSHTESL